MKQNKLIILLFSAFFIYISCSNNNEDVETSGYKRATISHNGFDFSEAKEETSPQLWDGSITKWQPGNGEHSTYKNNDVYLWWTNSGINNGVNATKYIGAGNDLSTITSVTDENWDSNPTILPLLKDNLYVAKCRDGYIKFRVISTSPNSTNWDAEIEYYFSKTKNFDK